MEALSACDVVFVMSGPDQAIPPDVPAAGLDGTGTLSRANLRDASVAGIRWIATTRLVAEIGTFASAVVLARLLAPSDFGYAAVALVMGPLATILTFEAFGAVLVQRASIDREHVGGALVGSLALGLLLSALTVLLAPHVGGRLFSEKTAQLLQLMAPTFLIGAIGAVPRATLMRRLDFRQLSVIEVAGLLIGAVVAVVLAARGVGADALIVGYLVTQGTQTVLMFRFAPLSNLRMSRRALREVSRFGTPTALAGLVATGRNSVDYLVLGLSTSPAQLGIYYRAFQLGAEYQEKVSSIIVRMILPVYSRARSLEDMRSIHQKVTRLHAVLIFPLLGILIAVAPVIVPFVFGGQWEEAVVPTQILAIAGMASTLLAGHAQVIVAAGNPQALLRYNVVSIMGYALVVFLAAPYGIAVVAATVAAVHVLMLFTVYVFLFERLVGIPLTTLVREVSPAATGTVVVVVVGTIATNLTRRVGLFEPVALLAAVGMSLGVYAVVLRVAFRKVWQEVLDIARRLRRPHKDSGSSYSSSEELISA